MRHARFLLALALLACWGCDFGEKERAERAEAERARQAEERARQELASFRVSMETFAAAKLKLAETARAEAVKKREAAHVDVERLTSIIAEIAAGKTAQGDELDQETKLLRAMKHPEVNALARKYLSVGFELDAEAFVGKIREYRAQKAKYEAEIQRSDAQYEASLAEARRWASATKEQREAEMRRQQREIVSLEAQREKMRKDLATVTRRSMGGSRDLERDRRERGHMSSAKLADLESEIAKRRNQLDFLRNPQAMRHLATRATEESQFVQNRAAYNRRYELNDIDRRLKPKQTATELSAEFEARTLARLRGRMQDACAALEKESQDLEKRAALIREARLAIPVSDMPELKRLRSRID